MPTATGMQLLTVTEENLGLKTSISMNIVQYFNFIMYVSIAVTIGSSVLPFSNTTQGPFNWLQH